MCFSWLFTEWEYKLPLAKDDNDEASGSKVWFCLVCRDKIARNLKSARLHSRRPIHQKKKDDFWHSRRSRPLDPDPTTSSSSASQHLSYLGSYTENDHDKNGSEGVGSQYDHIFDDDNQSGNISSSEETFSWPEGVDTRLELPGHRVNNDSWSEGPTNAPSNKLSLSWQEFEDLDEPETDDENLEQSPLDRILNLHFGSGTHFFMFFVLSLARLNIN